MYRVHDSRVTRYVVSDRREVEEGEAGDKEW